VGLITEDCRCVVIVDALSACNNVAKLAFVDFLDRALLQAADRLACSTSVIGQPRDGGSILHKAE
jgi:hypothetical protein